jgi:hypothetical protein
VPRPTPPDFRLNSGYFEKAVLMETEMAILPLRSYLEHVFAGIAIDLGLTADQVHPAFSYVGPSGITIHVTEEDRVALARYKSKL